MWALSTGYTPLGTDCCSVGSLRATVPASSLCRHGLSMGCRWLCAPLWSSVSCRDTICFTVVFSTGIPAPVPGTPPPLLHWARCLQGGLSPLARLPPPDPSSQLLCGVFYPYYHGGAMSTTEKKG